MRQQAFLLKSLLQNSGHRQQTHPMHPTLSSQLKQFFCWMRCRWFPVLKATLKHSSASRHGQAQPSFGILSCQSGELFRVILKRIEDE
jgi:hypothetical protein